MPSPSPLSDSLTPLTPVNSTATGYDNIVAVRAEQNELSRIPRPPIMARNSIDVAKARAARLLLYSPTKQKWWKSRTPPNTEVSSIAGSSSPAVLRSARSSVDEISDRRFMSDVHFQEPDRLPDGSFAYRAPTTSSRRSSGMSDLTKPILKTSRDTSGSFVPRLSFTPSHAPRRIIDAYKTEAVKPRLSSSVDVSTLEELPNTSGAELERFPNSPGSEFHH